MRIRIYQINPERDERHSMFRSYDENRAINPDEYDSVFDADVDCKNLEQIFSQFNTTYHPLFRGRSLSALNYSSIEYTLLKFLKIASERHIHNPHGYLRSLIYRSALERGNIKAPKS